MIRLATTADVMGTDRIRYFLHLEGRWRWRPTQAMRSLGFHIVKMGKGGPELDEDGRPGATLEDKQHAIKLNEEWDRVRFGTAPAPKDAVLKRYPAGSIGEAWLRVMSLRKAEQLAKGVVQSKEQEGRDDWPRAWKQLATWAQYDPKTITPEHFLRVDSTIGAVKGLVVDIEREISITERHRVIKVWRAFFRKMQAMGYVPATADDPSLAFANSAPDPRQAIWTRREVLRRVQRAWRMEYYGLAACIAVAWDSMLSPVDARRLTPAQAARDGTGLVFWLDRAKTGRAAAGTLTPWSEQLLRAYLTKLGAVPAANAPIFRNRSGDAYTKDTLGDDFRAIRAAININDTRQLADMRRSGAVEGDAGGGSETDQSNKMANSVATNKRLRKTYNPVNVESVRRFDEARARGAALLEQSQSKSIRAPAVLTLLQNRASVK